MTHQELEDLRDSEYGRPFGCSRILRSLPCDVFEYVEWIWMKGGHAKTRARSLQVLKMLRKVVCTNAQVAIAVGLTSPRVRDIATKAIRQAAAALRNPDRTLRLMASGGMDHERHGL